MTFGTGDHTPLGEDEAVAALEWALEWQAEKRNWEWKAGKAYHPPVDYATRALLDRERWLLDWAKDSDGYCAECGGYLARSEDAHVRNCSVALWTRAAKRVGLC